MVVVWNGRVEATCQGAPVIISWTVLTLQAVWDSRLQFEILTVSPGTKEVMESAKCLIFEVHVYIVWASGVTSVWNTRL